MRHSRNESAAGRHVLAAFQAVLPENVELAVQAGEARDFLVFVNQHRLEVEWMSHAWLGQVRRVVERRPRPDVVVSDRVSPASRKALAEAEIGWIETTGDAEIATDFLIVSRRGRASRNPKAAPAWTPTVLGVAEAVLCGVRPTVSATHEATGLSGGACTKALRALTDLGLLEAGQRRGRKSGRSLSDPDRLLDVYVAAAHDLEDGTAASIGVVWRDAVDGLLELGRRWESAGVQWAATGLVAAAVVAPLVTSIGTATAYVEGKTIAEMELAARKIGLDPIEGGRLVLSPFPTATTRQMATLAGGMRVAPWPRLVADLRRTGVRGEDAAEHLREVVRHG